MTQIMRGIVFLYIIVFPVFIYYYYETLAILSKNIQFIILMGAICAVGSLALVDKMSKWSDRLSTEGSTSDIERQSENSVKNDGKVIGKFRLWIDENGLTIFIIYFVILAPVGIGFGAFSAPAIEGYTGLGGEFSFFRLIYYLVIGWGAFFLLSQDSRRPILLVVTIISHSIGFIMLFATHFRWYGLEGQPSPLDNETAIYFSIVTWTTLGYGDLKPNESTRLLAATEALLGYIYLGLFVAAIFNLLANTRSKNE